MFSKFGRTYAAHLLIALMLVTVAYSVGYNGGGFSWAQVGTATGNLFGGLPSMFSLLGAACVVVLVGTGIWWFADPAKGRGAQPKAAMAVGTVGIVVAGFGLWPHVSLPDVRLMQLVALMAVVAVETTIVGWIRKP